MIPDRASVVRYRLERAQESLAEAHLLLDAGHTNTFVNRLYYACFYAASAALLAKDKVATSHGRLRSLVHQHLVKPGLLSVDMGRFYDTLFDNRQKGDYADFVRFDAHEVQGWFERATELVQHLRAVAEELLTSEPQPPAPTPDP